MNSLPCRILTPRLPPVSRIAFGSLTVSAMQRNLPPDEAAAVMAYAFDSGIILRGQTQNFFRQTHQRG